MVKMKSLLVVAALFAVTVIGLASCAVKPEQALIGKWVHTSAAGVKITYEFKKKGELSATRVSGGNEEKVNAKWSATEIAITMTLSNGATREYPYTLSGKTLTITDPSDSSTMTFTKQ